MSYEIDKELSRIYNPRFGRIAVKKGYATPEQLKQGLMEQLDDDLADRPHRLIGRIMLDNGWMTPGQIEDVLNEMFAWKKKEKDRDGKISRAA